MDKEKLTRNQQDYIIQLLIRYQGTWKQQIKGILHGYALAIYLKHYHPIVSRSRYCSEAKRGIIK